MVDMARTLNLPQRACARKSHRFLGQRKPEFVDNRREVYGGVFCATPESQREPALRAMRSRGASRTLSTAAHRVGVA